MSELIYTKIQNKEMDLTPFLDKVIWIGSKSKNQTLFTALIHRFRILNDPTYTREQYVSGGWYDVKIVTALWTKFPELNNLEVLQYILQEVKKEVFIKSVKQRRGYKEELQFLNFNQFVERFRKIKVKTDTIEIQSIPDHKEVMVINPKNNSVICLLTKEDFYRLESLEIIDIVDALAHFNQSLPVVIKLDLIKSKISKFYLRNKMNDSFREITENT